MTIGAERIAKFVLGYRAKAHWSESDFRLVTVNGTPGLLLRHPLAGIGAYSFDIVDGRIRAIYVVRNPDKPRRFLEQLPGAGEQPRPALAEIGHLAVRYDSTVRLRDAIEMLAESGVDTLGPTTWADLGCGTGTFTLALADRLSPGSTIHAMDRDSSVLRRIPPEHRGVRITTHRGDFTDHTWPFANLDGILMANSLHYVDSQTTFIRRCERRMTVPRRFLIVEYDTDESSRWVPHPVSRKTLTSLFTDAGYSSITMLRSRPSVYRRAALYAAFVKSSPA